jgi:hypothetical protein
MLSQALRLSVLLVFFGVLLWGVFPVFKKSKPVKRNLRGIELTPKEWSVLASLANYQRKSQASLISEVLKVYVAQKGHADR